MDLDANALLHPYAVFNDGVKSVTYNSSGTNECPEILCYTLKTALGNESV